jgi:hypothetical protein
LSLCENAISAAVAALQINNLGALRTVFSHRLGLKLAARPAAVDIDPAAGGRAAG